MKFTRVAAVVGMVLAAGVVSACAARSPIGKARVGALVFSRAAHDVKLAEDQLFAANLPEYDKAKHQAVQQKVRAVLVAAVAYDDAAKQLKPGDSKPQAVIDAGNALVVAVTELSKSIPKLGGAERALVAVVAGLQSSIATYLATPMNAEMPFQGVFGLVGLLLGLIQQGRIEVDALKELLKKSGATDDEIDAAAGVVRQDIADIDSEQAK